MKYLVITTFVALLAGCSSGSDGQSALGPQITVTGNATIEVEPDQFVISVDVKGYQTDQGAMLSFISSQMEQIQSTVPRIEGLDELEVFARDVATNSVLPNGCDAPRYGQERIVALNCEPVAYAGEVKVTIKGKPATEAGNVVSFLTEKGVNSARITSFVVSDTAAAQAKADEAAVEDAINKAERLAAGANGSLGAIIEISDGSANLYERRRNAAVPPPPPPPEPESTPVVLSASAPIAITPQPKQFSAKAQVRVELVN